MHALFYVRSVYGYIYFKLFPDEYKMAEKEYYKEQRENKRDPWTSFLER